jgi:transcriptional regulator with XRE-family HTH domain
MYLSKNLRYLRRKHNRLTQEELAEKLGLTRSVISSYEDGRAEPSVATLIKMSEFFGTSIESITNLDLISVDEKKVIHQKEVKKYASAVGLRVQSINVENTQPVIFSVPAKAAAGYTAGNADPSTLENTPKYLIPTLNKNKEYRAFEILGDSMLPLPSKSTVIGERVELSDVKDGNVYVVVSKEGVVLKKVYNRTRQTGTLLLKSSNLIYSPYEIETESVLELWKFYCYISDELPQQNDDMSDIKEAFRRLEAEVQELKKNTE